MPPKFKVKVKPGTFRASAGLPYSASGPIAQAFILDRHSALLVPPPSQDFDFRSSSIQIEFNNPTQTTIPAPPGIVDFDIVFIAIDRAENEASDTITWPPGFTELWSTTYSGGSMSGAWKRAANESGGYTLSYSGTTQSVAICYAISAPEASGDPTMIGTTATGTSATPDPPNVDPGSNVQRIAITVYGMEGETTVVAPPAGYTEPPNSSGNTGPAGIPPKRCTLGMSYRLYKDQAEDPGPATFGFAGAWAAQTIVFNPPVVTLNQQTPFFGRRYQSPFEEAVGVHWSVRGLPTTWHLQYAPNGTIAPAGTNLALRLWTAGIVAQADVMYLPTKRVFSSLDYDTLIPNEFQLVLDFNDRVNDVALDGANITNNFPITVEPFWP